MKLLLERGASVNDDDNMDWFESPLCLGAWFGSEAMVRLLLDRGADVHSRDYFGRTTLHSASRRKDSDAEGVIKLLIERGADVKAWANDGCTVLHDSVE